MLSSRKDSVMLRPSGSIKVGMIGCGRATVTSHLPALRYLSDLEVVALADIDPSRLQKVAPISYSTSLHKLSCASRSPHRRQLRERREILIADDQLVVSHNQTWGFWGTFAAHFHNGRSIAGFRLQQISWVERFFRLGGCLMLPPYLLWITVGPVIRKRRLLKPALASLPLTTLVVTCHAAGEFVGYIFGPGNSPQRLA